MPSAEAIERSIARGDETAHDVGARADVDSRDDDGGVFTSRILADAERPPRLQARDDDHDVDHDRQDRTTHKNVGKCFHKRHE